MSASEQRRSTRADEPAPRRPFRAVDVLSGSIDRRTPAKSERTRKQISAQLEPAQVRLLGELHARVNAGASKRIEKSDLVGLGIELLAAALQDAEQGLASASGNGKGVAAPEVAGDDATESPFDDVEQLRTYVRTYVRGEKS